MAQNELKWHSAGMFWEILNLLCEYSPTPFGSKSDTDAAVE